MRKWTAGLLLLCGVTAYAIDNKMQMVSYFPTPYVSYNDVTVTQFCDVGLLNQCQMAVGPGNNTLGGFTLVVEQDTDKPDTHPLNTGLVAVQSGRLNLNSAAGSVYSKRTDFGLNAGNPTAVETSSEITFGHQANIKSADRPRSVSATTSARINALKMYPAKVGSDFPGCSAGVTWKRLPIGIKGNSSSNDAFLVCGGGTGKTCGGYKPASSQSCGLCGTQTREVYCDATGVWRTGVWTACTNQKPNESLSCTSGGFQCGGLMTRSVDCNGTDWTASSWNTGNCWNKNCNNVDTSCNLGCGGYSCTPTCEGGVRTGSCWSAYGGYTETHSCPVGQTGSRTYSCSDGCSGATNCRYTSDSCTDTPTEPEEPEEPVTPPAGCTNGEKQACGNCGTKTCTDGKWGSCAGEGVCKPGDTGTQKCTDGATGNQTRTCSASCMWGGWNDSGCKKEEFVYKYISRFSRSSVRIACTPNPTQPGMGDYDRSPMSACNVVTMGDPACRSGGSISSAPWPCFAGCVNAKEGDSCNLESGNVLGTKNGSVLWEGVCASNTRLVQVNLDVLQCVKK